MDRAPLTAQAVADLVGGRLLGNGATMLRRIGPLDRAGPDTLSLLVSTRYLPYFRASQAGAVLVAPAFESEPSGPATRIVVDDPYRVLLGLLPRFVALPERPAGVHPTAVLGPGVTLGEAVYLGPYVVLGAGVRIGARSRLEAGVVLEDGVEVGEDCSLGAGVVCHQGTRLGNRVVLKAHAVLGGQGFGFLPSPAGHQRIPHVGACIIEDEVEIGSGTMVDRGSIDDTVIGRGTKIDNLVHVAHNMRIGAHCLIMATCGIAGSSRIGDRVVLAGGVGIADHIEVGDGAMISARSTVISSVPAGATYGGYPARPHRDFLRAQATLQRLVPLARKLEHLVEEQRAASND